MSPAIANSPKASSLSLLLQGASADTARFPAVHDATDGQPVPASRATFSRPHRISPVENSFPSNSGDYVASSIGALEQSYDQDTVRMFNRIRQARRQHGKSSDSMSSMSGAHSHSLADALFLNYSTSETIATMQPVSEIIPPMVKEQEDSDDSDFIFELDL